VLQDGDVWEAIALSFALAMDATAVSAARGIALHAKRELVILPLLFGGFQSGMSALGWLGGRWGGPLIERYQDWVACVLLVGIGVKMIVEAIRKRDDDNPETGVLIYLGLAIATSIDAAAAGLTLPLLPVEPWLAIVLIGAITAACSAAGYLLGRAFSAFDKLEIVGGLVLVGMGIRLVV
jgi:putative Mn2+ efflux pump MntP